MDSDTAPGTPTQHASLGPRLRSAREQRGLTQRQVAKLAGLSHGLISQVETGRANPSVDTLYAIVNAMDLPLAGLFAEPEHDRDGRPANNVQLERSPQRAAAVSDHDASVVQRGDARQVITLDSGVRWERLTPSADPDVDFFLMVYDVGGASSTSGELVRHAGREFALVLSGGMHVTIAFDEYELSAGDSITFSSAEPHAYRNAGAEPATMVMVVVRQPA